MISHQHSALRSARITVGLLVACQSAQSLGFAALALFLPEIRADQGLTFAQAGALSAAMNLTYAALQLPSGYIADRYGAKRLFTTGLFGASALTFTWALVHGFPALIGNQVAGGLFRSLMFAPGVLLITSLFPEGRRATAIAVYVTGGFAANLLLSTAGPLLEPVIGWRGDFVGISVLGAVLAGLFWRFCPPDRIKRGRSDDAAMGLRLLLASPVLWLVGIIQFARLAVAQGIVFWLPTFLVLEKHFSLQSTGYLMAVMAVVTVPATFLGGYLSDKSRRPAAIVSTSLGLLMVTTFLITRVDSVLLLVLVIAGIGVFVQLYFGPLYAWPVEMLGQSNAGFITGFGNLFANVGAVIMAVVIGFLRDRSGSFTEGFDLVAATCLVGVATAMFLGWRGGRGPSPALEAAAAPSIG